VSGACGFLTGGGATMLAVVERVISATAARMHPLISLWRVGFFTLLSKGIASSLLPRRLHHLTTKLISMLL